MTTLQQARDYTEKLFNVKWVKWIHEGSVSAKTSSEKSINVILGSIGTHCSICLNLNGCCFTQNNCPTIPRRFFAYVFNMCCFTQNNCPTIPLHQNCHCITIDINAPNIQAECPIEKFSKYTFVESLKNDKKQLFESWGYDILDSEYLQQEFIKQAQLAYSVGNYTLGKLDENGQRISIKITLKRKNTTEHVSFLSGWMVYPNGKIILTTPYGGK